jgi:hypothetical protein
MIDGYLAVGIKAQALHKAACDRPRPEREVGFGHRLCQNRPDRLMRAATTV